MTSTLQANNIFGNNPFTSAAFYGKTANTRSYTADSFSGTVFGSNIWQPHSQADPATNRDNVRQNAAGRQPGLSLILPQNGMKILGHPGDKRSPITSEPGSTRQLEPSSAHSRSQHEIALLTPSSLTSQSEITSQAGNTKQNQRGQRSCAYGTQQYQEQNHPWPTAKEFQPAFATNTSRPINGSTVDLAKRGAGYANTAQIGGIQNSALETIWGQKDINQTHGLLARSNNFRPVLPASTSFDKVDEIADALRGFKLDQQQTQHNGFYPTSHQTVTNNVSRLRQNKGQDRRGIEQYHFGTWSRNTYAHDYNPQNASTNQLYPPPYLGPMNQVSKASYHNDFDPKSSTQHSASGANAFIETTSRSAPHFTDYSTPSLHAYVPQHYENAYYAHANGLVDMNNGMYTIDQNLAGPYMVGDPALDHPSEPSHIIRSPLLEEFRVNGKTKKYELKDIHDHIVEFSGDQLGSRFIQHKLEVANSDEKDRVFNEIARDSRQLMTDVFGNYVIQKMFEHGNQSQKKVLASHMKGHVYALSTQTYGCRVVQKALEHILTDQQASLIKELDGVVLKVVENQNGNHVIQKAIERIPGEHIQFIVDAHRGHVHYLSKHSYGCRVIQRMLEHCQPRAKRQILNELHEKIGDLIQDAFGNYVVQHVIVNGEAQDRKPVIDKVQSRLLENAMHKFASNVVEKALDYAEEDQSRAMLRKLTTRDEHGHSQIIKLLSHQYGNYVIQKSAAHLSGHALLSLIDEMEQYLAQLKRVSTGKQVTALEISIQDARKRLNTQRYDNGMHNAPTQPRRSIARR